MKITDVSLRRPVTVIILTTSLVLFGFLALKSMGIQRIPDVDFPVVTVTTTMQGASATVMDHDVADEVLHPNARLVHPDHGEGRRSVRNAAQVAH